MIKFNSHYHADHEIETNLHIKVIASVRFT